MRDNETCIDLLERVRYITEKWVVPGHRKGRNTHNISVTLSVKPDEWPAVGDWMYTNRSMYNGMAVLPFDGGSYMQTPFETCSEQEYERLLGFLKKIDLADVLEVDDFTQQRAIVACAGGKCDL